VDGPVRLYRGGGMDTPLRGGGANRTLSGGGINKVRHNPKWILLILHKKGKRKRDGRIKGSNGGRKVARTGGHRRLAKKKNWGKEKH